STSLGAPKCSDCLDPSIARHETFKRFAINDADMPAFGPDPATALELLKLATDNFSGTAEFDCQLLMGCPDVAGLIGKFDELLCQPYIDARKCNVVDDTE